MFGVDWIKGYGDMATYSILVSKIGKTGYFFLNYLNLSEKQCKRLSIYSVSLHKFKKQQKMKDFFEIDIQK